MRNLLLCSLVAGLSSGSLYLAAGPATDAGPHVWLREQPAQGAGQGLTASYFGNGSLAGAPVLRRVDPTLDFQWGAGSPGPGVPADNFSARWEGQLAATATGSYRFVAKTNDEVRLWINGKKVLDTFGGNKRGGEGSATLAAGEKASIKFEFAAAEGDARLQLQWMPPGSGPQNIPTAALFPLGWTGAPDPADSAAPVADQPTAPPEPAKPAPPVAKAVAETEKAEAKVAKAEAKRAKAEEKVAEVENKVAKAEQKADKASAKVVQAEADTAPAPAIVEPGVYVITAYGSDRPLQVRDPGRPNAQVYLAAGAVPVTRDARSDAPQWRVESLGNGFYRLLVPGSNKVLEVLGAATSNGAELNLWPYYSGNNQLWRIEATDRGYYKILAKHSNKALTVRDSVENGVRQWRYSGRETQQWKLTPVAAEEPAPLLVAGARPGVGANKMSIYPNPSNGVVQLRYELPEAIPMGWVLYNQSGAPVRVSDYRRQSAGPHHQTLDFTGLPPGDYNLRMTVGTVTTRESLQLRKPKPGEAEAAAPSGGGN